MLQFLKRRAAEARDTAIYQALDRNISLRVSVIALIIVVLGLCAFGFFHSAPPDTITITSGPPGSQFQRYAEQYRTILARSGVKLKILPSGGSLDNIHRLNDPRTHVDVGFVQGGIKKDQSTDNLVSLGSMFYEPLMIFYRSPQPLTLLSAFKGKTLVLGPEGTGAHYLGLNLLHLNGIDPGADTKLLNDSSDKAGQELLDGQVDAIFLMGDAANMQVMHKLLHDEHIRLFNFTQADAYARKEVFLSKLLLPMGSLDFGQNIPAEDVNLVGPTVELIARKDLHPALSDVLLEAAQQVHGRSSLLQRHGEFPAPLEHEYKISDDAARYYKSGKTFLFRYLPFWLASLTNRLIVVVVPVIVLLIPGLKLIPAIYNWRIRSRILRWYGALLLLERDVSLARVEDHRDLLRRLNHMEYAVNHLKIPVSFADQFYVLRGHIDFVRSKLLSAAAKEDNGNEDA